MDRSSIPAWAMPRVAVPDSERRQAIRSEMRYQYPPWGVPVSGAVSSSWQASPSSPLQEKVIRPPSKASFTRPLGSTAATVFSVRRSSATSVSSVNWLRMLFISRSVSI